MSVRVIKTEPHKSVVREVVCQACGATLSFIPNDIQKKVVQDYDGGSDTYCWIDCPQCAKKVEVSEF